MVDLRALSAAAGLLTLIAGGPAHAAEYPEPVCAKPLELLAAQGASVVDGLAPLPTGEPAPPPPPISEDNRATHDERAAAENPGVDERTQPPTTAGDPAEEKQGSAATPGPPAEEPAKADVADAIDSMCSALEAAAAANGLPLEFFVRVIWEESRFQPRAVGPLTRSGLRAQGIAQFMPYTAAERGLLDPLDPHTALPEAAEFLAELRREFGNLGLAAAAYNAGPGRLRDFIGRRLSGMPAQTRHYVRAITGRSIGEWVALGREDETDGITTRASCRQLAALLKERPSVFISKVERKVREAALRLPDIPDRRHAVTGPSGAKRTAAGLTGSAAARNRKLLLVRSASLLIPEKAARKPRSSAASEDSRSSSSTPAKSRKSIAGASRSAAATSSSSGSKAARAAAPKEVAQDKRATRTLRDATAGVAAVKRNAPPVRTASLAPTGQSRPSAASADSKSASAVAAKSGKRTTSEAAMPPASKSSPAKPAPDRARAGAPEKTSRDNAPVRVAARATASPASERDRNALQGRKGSVATSKNPDRKTIASAAPAEAGKSIGAARRSTLPKLSAARSAERLRASAMEKVVKAADGRVKKVMQICRGC